MGELEVIRNLNNIPEVVASAHIYEDIPIMYKLPDGRILEAILADHAEDSPDIILSANLEENKAVVEPFIESFISGKRIIVKTGQKDDAPVLKWFIAEYVKEARQ